MPTAPDQPGAAAAQSRDLPNQHVFNLDAEAFDAFAQGLNAPPAPNEALRRLMASTAPWD